MKKLELKNDDFLGYVKHLRHACRGIVVHEGKVLLGYEGNNNKVKIQVFPRHIILKKILS